MQNIIEKDKPTLITLLSSYICQNNGGAELQASYLCNFAIEHFNVHYIFLSTGHFYKEKTSLKLHPISRKKFCSRLGNVKYFYFLGIWNLLRSIRPIYIYQRCASGLTGIAAYYAKLNNCKLIFHIAHDRDVNMHPLFWTRPWLIPEQLLIRYGIKNADTIIAQTKSQSVSLLKNFGRNAVIISNGHPIPEECLKSDNPITVIWIANWKPIKQPERFVELVEKLRTLDNVRYVMVGRNENYLRLVGKAKSKGIEVFGEVSNDEVNNLLVQSHILINTSKQEGFSNTFIQAWLRNVPVVSLTVNPDNVFNDRKLGICSHTFEQLVTDTTQLITDPELRKRMGVSARDYAVQHHSLENFKCILDIMKN